MNIEFRSARRSDLARLVGMLADDHLGAERERFEDPLPESYLSAFKAIDSDPNNELLVADSDGVSVGFLQLTILPSLTFQGAWRAQIEGVRVAAESRGSGIGHELIEEAIRRARERGCLLVQLTTNKTRGRAVAFYEALGFEASHEGMKLTLRQE